MLFFLSISKAEATVCFRKFNYYPNDLADATGNVVAFGRNSIEIFDEENNRKERFVYLEQAEQYHQGDYIRIYYHPENGIVATIKKMTVLEYKQSTQNLGNIYHMKKGTL